MIIPDGRVLVDVDVLAAKLETLHSDVGEIKEALKLLSDAITKLALVEERQSQTSRSMERAFDAIDAINTRVHALERAGVSTTRAAMWVDRALWGAAGFAAMYVAKLAGLV